MNMMMMCHMGYKKGRNGKEIQKRNMLPVLKGYSDVALVTIVLFKTNVENDDNEHIEHKLRNMSA